jgi:trimeric autotransporter adhesin
MGRKNFIMIMMVALVTMLLMIMPVSAESVVVGRDISPGATIFIGEENLSITSAMNGYSTLGYWSPGSDLTGTSPSYTIPVASRLNSFAVTSVDFSGRTGNWYQIADDNTRKDLAFRVADPSVSLSILKSDGTNVNDKTVTAGTELTFQIDTNVILDNKRGDLTSNMISPVVSGFTATISSPISRTVTFTKIVSGTDPITYKWDFGDGSPVETTTSSSISHLYSDNGVYTVKLAANNTANGKSDQIKSSISGNITVFSSGTDKATVGTIINGACPVFSASETGLDVTLTDNSGSTSRTWVFGDGSHPSSINPVTHTYNVIAGSYNLTLTTSSPACSEFAPVDVTRVSYSVTAPSIISGSFVAPSPVAGIDTTKGYMNIVVKTESGGAYDRLVTSLTGMTTASLKHQYINKNPFVWNAVWNTGAKDNSDQRMYPSGVYTAYVESNLNNMKENYKNGGAYYTGKTVSMVSKVIIGSDTLKVTINKDSVVRGNDFSVTVIGQSGTSYNLFIKGVSNTITTAPKFIPYQEGVSVNSNTEATISTDTSGSRIIGFTTSSETKDQKYTIRVESTDKKKSDEVTISVVKGGMTLVAAGDQSYYIGEEVKLSGTNTETETTYFFIVGPNLDSNGASIEEPRTSVDKDFPDNYVSTDVDNGDTFTYTWATSGVDLDSGTYTIYGVSKPVDKTELQNAAYATVSVIIKKPYVSATSKGTVAKGDKILITGVAEGNPSQGVMVWIFGKNYAKQYTQTIESDGTYEYEIPGAETNTMSSGQYFVVVQHPMQNGVFDIVVNGDYIKNMVLNEGTDIFKLYGSGSLQGSDAAEALVQAISDPNIDDTYTKLTIFVQEPIISINTIGDKHIGDKFTIIGKTNLAVDDEILMEVYSSSFKPTQKTQSGEFSGATGTVKVLKSESGMNEFKFDIDASTFKVDEYLVMAQAIVQDTTGTALFNVIEGASVPVVTATPVSVVTPVVTSPPVVTAIPTVPPTVIPTTEIPTTTSAPGFGAVFALIGLGAVGFIVVRRE